MPRTATAMRPLEMDTPEVIAPNAPTASPRPRSRSGSTRRVNPAPPPTYTAAFQHSETSHHDAELFYLQKQIQLQTRMVFVLEDGQQIQGVIEWYDRCCIKVRGRNRVLLYKSAIKYMYKNGEIGTSPEN
jgi:sRNA-binding regulator protein Hfq